MAYADYHLCDLCEGKAFYDANVTDSRYLAVFDASEGEPIGIAVLCVECNKTHEAVIRPRAALEGEHGKCHPVQFSDQIVCGKCGLTWDVNDPQPPKCKEGRT